MPAALAQTYAGAGHLGAAPELRVESVGGGRVRLDRDDSDLLLLAATVTHLVVMPTALLPLLLVCIALSCGLYARWVRLVSGQITSAAMLDGARRKKG